MLDKNASYDERMLNATELIAESLSTIVEKLGGWDQDNLNVTLFTDSPIEVINKEEEK